MQSGKAILVRTVAMLSKLVERFDPADRMHESIGDRRPDELESLSLEFFCQSFRQGRFSRNLIRIRPMIDHRFAVNQVPQKRIQAAKDLLNLQRCLRVRYCGFYLRAISDDSRIRQEIVYLLAAEFRYLCRVKSEKGGTKGLSFA